MRILSIDTTVVAGSLALTDRERLIVQEQQGVAGTHCERLIGSIDHMLSLAGWRKDEIEGIAVAVGPGSFTGLRIGLAAAKGMALAMKIPIVGVSSLQSLARNGAGFAGTVVALIDARRGELFVAAWKVEAGGSMKMRADEFVAGPKEVVRRLKSIKGELLLVGDGAAAYEKELKKGLGRRAHRAQGGMAMAQAANLAIIAAKKLARGRGDDLSGLTPNYVRRSDAEIGFMARHRPKAKAEVKVEAKVKSKVKVRA